MQKSTNHQRYLSDLRAFQTDPTTNGPAWLRRVREGAAARFSEVGFPTARKGNEPWKYTNVAPVADATFKHLVHAGRDGLEKADVQRLAPWSDSWTNLVFVNGRHSDALSSASATANGIQATSLAQAMRPAQDVIERHLSRHAPVDGDGFAALNTAFVQDGAFVHIPEGETLERPLNLVFISTGGDEPTVSYPRVLVVAGPGSAATIVESYLGLSSGRYFTNGVSEMVVGDGARVDHYRLLTEGASAFHVGTARVRMGENSDFRSTAFARGAALGRYDLRVLLDGPGGSCSLSGLYLTSGTQHMDNLIGIDHAKPNGTSRLYYKGIMDGKSRAVFGGTVWVREGAMKTDSQQADRNLVLSPDAEVDSRPALYIYADDVKCSHGATAGNIDRDAIFYMRSRGVDLETASRLLIHGFAGEIIDSVRVEALRSYLERRLLQSLPAYTFQF